MATANGANTLNDLIVLAAFENETLRSALLMIGVGLAGTGIVLFAKHRQSWASFSQDADASLRLFEWRKFRRRSAVACLITISGFAMSAIYWTIDVRTVAILSLTLSACLAGVLGLAILDLMSVTIRRFAEDDQEAREKLVQEYHRMRKRADEKEPEAKE